MAIHDDVQLISLSTAILWLYSFLPNPPQLLLALPLLVINLASLHILFPDMLTMDNAKAVIHRFMVEGRRLIRETDMDTKDTILNAGHLVLFLSLLLFPHLFDLLSSLVIIGFSIVIHLELLCLVRKLLTIRESTDEGRTTRNINIMHAILFSEGTLFIFAPSFFGSSPALFFALSIVAFVASILLRLNHEYENSDHVKVMADKLMDEVKYHVDWIYTQARRFDDCWMGMDQNIGEEEEAESDEDPIKWEEERAKHEEERKKWKGEREKYEEELEVARAFEKERTKYEEERKQWEKDRAKYEEELEVARKFYRYAIESEYEMVTSVSSDQETS